MILPLSISHAHSLANLHKTPDEVVAELHRIRAARDAAGADRVSSVHRRFRPLPARLFDAGMGNVLAFRTAEPEEEAMIARADAVKWHMLEEWSHTKRAPRHAALRACCERPGYLRIDFGDCAGTVLAAREA